MKYKVKWTQYIEFNTIDEAREFRSSVSNGDVQLIVSNDGPLDNHFDHHPASAKQRVKNWTVRDQYYELGYNDDINLWWIWGDEDEEISGTIELCVIDGVWMVNDFDGYFDLPKEIKRELRSRGIVVDF